MLQSVELANFLSHSNTKIEFGKGVTVFVGPNGAGKSSMIDGITFALFGAHIRNSNKGLVRRGSNQAFAKVDFTAGDKEFVAIRKIDSKGTISAQLYEKNGDELTPLAAGERKQFGESMTRTIEQIIGLDFEKLKVASIVQQGELQSIIDADPKKFKQLVNAVIGIDKLDLAYELMRKTIDSFRESIRNTLEYDDTSIGILQSRLEYTTKEIANYEPQKSRLESEKKTREDEFDKLQGKIEVESPKEIKIRELENRRTELVQYLKDAISSIKTEISEKTRKLSDCTECLSILSSKSDEQVELKTLETKLETSRKEIKEVSEKIGKASGQEELAQKIRLVNGKCPVCDSKVDHLNPLFEEEHVRKELDDLKKKMDFLNTQELSIQEKKGVLEAKITQTIKAEQTLILHGVKDEHDLSQIRQEIATLRRNVEKIPDSISTSGSLLQLAIDVHSSSIINKISTLIEETKDFDAISFKNLRNNLEQKRRQLSLLDQELGAITQKLKSTIDERQKISGVLEELLMVHKYVSFLETIRNQIYNRDGPVATSLRSWALSAISQKASEYLSTFDVKIQRIALEDKSRDIGIACYSGNTTLELESLSGGEKVSVALALRLGMAHLMGSSNLNFIILDEPTTHLDQERRKSLVTVLSQAFEANLDAISQFVIITHDSEIFENSNIDAIYSFESTLEGTKVVPI